MSRLFPENTVRTVVDQHLCLSCGTCVSACPQNAISMVELPCGLLVASVDESLCNGCGLCYRVCPGDHLTKGSLRAEEDPFVGPVITVYCGQASDSRILQNGQSGGIATALLSQLMETGQIDQAIVTRMPKDGSLRPIVSVATNRSEILPAQGSQYCPVALNTIFSAIPKEGYSKTAVVGLPCHFHGLRNLYPLQYNSLLKIGLICDRIMSFCAKDFFITKVGVSRKNIISIRYRDKALGGWPGDVGIEDGSGNTHRVKQSIRHWCKGRFTPPRCYLCFDKMNVLADIVLGDAWGVRESKEGHSVILTRTERGQKLIDSVRKSGAIAVDPIDPRLVFGGQEIDRKRLDWTAYSHCWREMGNALPDLGIQERWEADLSAVNLEPYKRKLRQSLSLATAKSSSTLLAGALAAYRREQFRRFFSLSRWIRAIWKRVPQLKQSRG